MHTPPAAPMPPARPAVPGDAGGITRLRSALILSRPLDAHWLTHCTDDLAGRLLPGGDARAFVVDAPGGGLASCALALLNRVLPAPRYPRGTAARIQVVATDPAFRRRGCATDALGSLLARLERDGVTLYELYAHDGSAPFYARLGFTADPALMRRTWFPADAGAAVSGGGS
ncbi:GNAT family N-acetyltransferase [Streptomyces sp. NPDC088785]|uniref:GNAT family N-acetyltransferase n=1 Tax=Streptomyces sp. NPDC088785 TaxID=3365897 RepID=UPI003823201E